MFVEFEFLLKEYYNSIKIMPTKVPKSLRVWFIIHFFADYIAAIPIFLFPNQILMLFGWKVIDPIAVRLVAAAFFAIGGASLI